MSVELETCHPVRLPDVLSFLNNDVHLRCIWSGIVENVIYLENDWRKKKNGDVLTLQKVHLKVLK